MTRWDYSENTPNWISGYSPELPLRDKLGKLVNVEGKDIALTQNATFGSNFVANGLSLKSGDEVILTDREHPGAICAWQERAKKDRIVLKQVPIPTPANDPDQLVELFAGTITSRTRVLAFPHIISSTAVVLPARRLTELAHQHGCLALVDGAQALGQTPVDLQDIGCDAYFASPHKWLLAPPGNGMFYIRRDQREKFWTTLCSFAWDDQTDGMYRFMQYGTGNRSLLTGLDAALDFHFRIGPGRIYKRMRFLADRLRNGKDCRRQNLNRNCGLRNGSGSAHREIRLACGSHARFTTAKRRSIPRLKSCAALPHMHKPSLRRLLLLLPASGIRHQLRKIAPTFPSASATVLPSLADRMTVLERKS